MAAEQISSNLQHAAAVDELRSRLAEAEAATASAEQRASSAEALVVKLRKMVDDANGLIRMSDRRKEILYSQVTYLTPNHATSLDMHQCCKDRHGRHSCLIRCRQLLPLRVLIYAEHRPSYAQP
jgi:hypothetical protein